MRAGWAHARRLLCVRLDSIGDVLMTTPALRALAADGRRVTLLTSAAGAAVARLVPEVADVIVYAAPWIKATEPREQPREDLATVARLRRRRFDAAVVFTVYSQSPLPAALLCFLAGIPLRAAHCRENPYQLLTDWIAEREPEHGVRHETQRQLDLVAALGFTTTDQRLSLAVPAAAAAAARALLAELGTSAWVAIHPGATAPSRRYPPEHFAEVARRLVGRGWQVVFKIGRAHV